MLGAIIMAVLVETAVVHMLVSLWIAWVAWILTISGVSSIVWLLRDFNAARLNPSLLMESGLRLRTGLRWRADLSWVDILGTRDDRPVDESVSMTLFGQPDFWLECKQPILVHGPFGIRRTVSFIGVGVDDPDAFRTAIQSRIAS